MSEHPPKKPGMADSVAARRKHKDCFLDEIDRLIDWQPLEKGLRQTLKRVANATGNPASPPLLMFKMLLLQRWYNGSDVAVEEALYDRLSCVRFMGLSLDHDEVPDATTSCRFRQSLVKRTLRKRLLDKRNHQLERRGLLVREGSIVDARVVSSTRRPIKVLDMLPAGPACRRGCKSKFIRRDSRVRRQTKRGGIHTRILVGGARRTVGRVRPSGRRAC